MAPAARFVVAALDAPAKTCLAFWDACGIIPTQGTRIERNHLKMSENPIMQYKKKLNMLSLLMVLLAVLHLLAAVLGFASGKLDQALMIAASAVSAVTAVLMFIMGLNGLKQVRGKTGSRTHLTLTWVALVCSVAVIVLQIAGGAASWLAIAVAAVSCVLAPVFAKAAGDLYQRRAARED